MRNVRSLCSDLPSRIALLEPLECRRLLSVEPIMLHDEFVLPGDLQTGPATNQQLDPHLAPGPDGITLAVWADYRTGGGPNQYLGSQHGTMADIWAARIAADGTLIDQIPIAINHDDWNQRAPKAAWNGSEWFIAWSSEKSWAPTSLHIEGTRLSVQGEILDPEPILIMDDRYLDQWGNPTNPEGPHDVEPAGSGFVVTWSRMEPPVGGLVMAAVFGTLVAADGTVPDQDGVLLRRAGGLGLYWYWGGLSYSPSNGGQLLQAYATEGSTPSYEPADRLHVMRRNLDLSPIDTSPRVMTIGDFNPYQQKLVGSPAGWLMAYRNRYTQNNPWISAVRIDTDATFLDAAPLTVSPAGGDPKVGAAFDGNGYVVTYSDYNNMYGRRISTSGVMASPVVIKPQVPQAMQTLGNGDGNYSVLFVTSGNPDIVITKVAADDSAGDVTDVSTAARAHSSPKVASDGTNSLAVFLSIHSNSVILKGVRLSPTGEPIDLEPFTIATGGGSPEVVFFSGRYIVAFRLGGSIVAQQVGTDGQLIGAPVPLMTDSESTSALSVIGDRMLVTGQKFYGGSTPQYSHIYGRIFDDVLAPVTERFTVGTVFTVTSDIAPVGGQWLVAMLRRTLNMPHRYAVSYRYVGTDGTMTEETDLVSTYPDNRAPSVVSAGEDAAEAMIVWQRFDAPPGSGLPILFPNSGEGIVGQRMGADGTRIGPLITLIDEPGSSAANEAVFDGSNYIITWVDTRDRQHPRQEQGDVYAARVAIDGTVLDPGGFPVANSDRPEYSATAVTGAGRTYFVYRSFRYEAPWASYRITTRLMDDITGPSPEHAQFNFDLRQDLGFVINERLFNINTADLLIVNRDTGQTVDPALFNLVERVGTAHEWEYDWVYTGAFVPDGNYRATLPAGSVTDKAGNPLAQDVVVDFWFLLGDVNRDREVGLADLLKVRQNFGQAGVGYTGGDVNYDGVVDLADLLIVRGRFGMVLPPPRGAGGGGGDDGDGGGRSLFFDGGDGGSSGITVGWFDGNGDGGDEDGPDRPRG